MKASNKKTVADGSVNLVDLFFYLLSYWYWFVLGVLICGGYAAYKYAKSTLVYQANATVIIKDPSNQASGARLDTYNNLINRTNVSNEILQFKSKDLMTEVVKRINANVSYKTQVKLRQVELYTATPVQVHFLEGLADIPMSLTMVPTSETNVDVTLGGKTVHVTLGDTLSVKGGRLLFSETPYFSADYYGQKIDVIKSDATSVARGLLNRMAIRQTKDNASILDFVLQDYSSRRACDVLNMLFEVYNENAINDKRQISVNTAAFINERIRVIGEELGDVESELQAFQTQHRMMSAGEAANTYLQKSRESGTAIVELETKLRLANYVKDYILNDPKSDQMIPTNTGLEDLRIEGLINEYNNTRIQRDHLLADSSEDNPVIKNLNSTLASIKANILSNIENLIMSLNVKKADAEKQESEAFAKFTSMPSTAREMIGIERKQNIKESLYIYLLNKREENALSQAMVDNNARVIASSVSSSLPSSSFQGSSWTPRSVPARRLRNLPTFRSSASFPRSTPAAGRRRRTRAVTSITTRTARTS